MLHRQYERLSRWAKRRRNRLDRSYNKVFGIGYNKTGTTTLNALFRHYELRVPKQGLQEITLEPALESGDYSGMKDFIGQYDAFQDLPFSQGSIYAACDALFPGSKFILTIRDCDEWFSIIYNFHKLKFGFQDKSDLSEIFFKGKNFYLGEDYVYRAQRRMVTKVSDGSATVDWSLLYDKDHYISLYSKRNEEIVRYFSNRPSDLLVIDITKEVDTAKLCEFLGIDNKLVAPMPHMNRTPQNIA